MSHSFYRAWQAPTRAEIDAEAERRFGSPNKRLSTTREWRFRRRGSLALCRNRGLWFDHECGHGGVLFASPPTESATRKSLLDASQEEDKRAARALAIWAASIPIAGTPAELYLRETRGIALDPLPDDLRFNPSLRHPENSGLTQGMVALWRDIASGRPTAILRTYLSEGRKIGGDRAKMSLGPTRGAVIQLAPSADVTTRLALAEGIESALSATALGFGPVWACGDVGHLRKFPVLAGIEVIEIFADDDAPGRTAAQVCAERWAAAGAEAIVTTVKVHGAKDINDLAQRYAT